MKLIYTRLNLSYATSYVTCSGRSWIKISFFTRGFSPSTCSIGPCTALARNYIMYSFVWLPTLLSICCINRFFRTHWTAWDTFVSHIQPIYWGLDGAVEGARTFPHTQALECCTHFFTSILHGNDQRRFIKRFDYLLSTP